MAKHHPQNDVFFFFFLTVNIWTRLEWLFTATTLMLTAQTSWPFKGKAIERAGRCAENKLALV